jgi:hypothetical protein
MEKSPQGGVVGVADVALGQFCRLFELCNLGLELTDV